MRKKFYHWSVSFIYVFVKYFFYVLIKSSYIFISYYRKSILTTYLLKLQWLSLKKVLTVGLELWTDDARA